MFTITSGTASSNPGGKLLVGGRSDNALPYKTFTVGFDRNVEIKNYKSNPSPYDYSTSASIKNGETTIRQDRNYSDMHMSEQSYLIFNEIRKLDRNGETFSAEDIALAKSKGYDITGNPNEGNGIVTIKAKDGWEVTLDFETDAEIEERQAAEMAREKYALTEDEFDSACDRGEAMQDCLHGWTTDGDWKEFIGYVDKTDARNVMQTLFGYRYEACDDSMIYNSERFFQQLFTEDRNFEDKKDVAQKIATYVLEYVQDNKVLIKDPSQQQTLQEIENSLKSFTYNESTMSNNAGKLLDNKIDALIKIFKDNLTPSK